MNHQPLIPIFTGIVQGEFSKLVSARKLYAFLECDYEFIGWLNSRIEKYGFEEGRDFIVHLVDCEISEYSDMDFSLTLDMAKELAVIEGTEKGRKARRYFITMEHCAKFPDQSYFNLAPMSVNTSDVVRTVFRFDEAYLRVLYFEEGWWFPASDIGKALGRRARAVTLLRDLRACDVAYEILDGQEEWLASEAGMYTVFDRFKGLRVETVRAWFISWLIPHLRKEQLAGLDARRVVW